MGLLTVEREGPIKRLVLNRPEKRNALSLALATELQQQVELSETDGTRLLVLRGEGPGFCAGFDFSEFPDCSEGDLLLHFVRIELMLQAIAHCSVDTLVFVHGQTLGAGADLALACRMRVGATDARMLFPGARFGLVLGSRRLAACVGSDQAQGLIGGHSRIDAQQAKALGLLNDVLEPARWAEHEAQVLAHVLATPADSRAMILRALRPDTRTQDLTDLVKSAAAADIKQRLAAYLGQPPAAARQVAAS